MAEITPIETNLPHQVSEVVCLVCLKRWVAVRPETTLLKQLQCPACKRIGFVIETGENLDLTVEEI